MNTCDSSICEYEDLEGFFAGIFEEMCEHIEPVFRRPETRERAKAYIRGLLSTIKRKNGWQLSEDIGESTPYNIQYILNRASWEADELRDKLMEYVCKNIGDANGVAVLDETGFIKKGDKSVGVQRQYSGTAGRIENCQIGVFLSYTSSKGHTLIDRELYLPKSWTEDRERCNQANVPNDVEFATKPELAIKMIKRVLSTKLPIEWFTGDSVYGSSRSLRAFLEEQRRPYAFAVKSNEQVIVEEKMQRVDEIAAALAASEWQILSCGNGSKGPRLYHWARIPLKSSEIDGWGHSLVIRKSLEVGKKAPDTAYVLVFAPTGTTLKQMVEVIGDRWTVEECFEDEKGQVGLDEYEVRNWQGWYRHITFCMVAMAFLVVLRSKSQTPVTPINYQDRLPEPTHQPESSLDTPSPQVTIADSLPLMVPFSVSEIKRLFCYIINFKPLSTVFHIAWSVWRRTHQAVAKFYHYRRRILDSPAYLPL